MTGYAAIVLAGGAGRRLGGAAKPTLPVGGAPMLARVLAAVADAAARIVVGPAALAGDLPSGVLLTIEQPPGGGPVAATAAGLATATAAGHVAGVAAAPAGHVAGAAVGGAAASVPARAVPFVALLAADLPFLTPGAVHRLSTRVSTLDGAVYMDRTGRRQLLCGLWRVAALRDRLTALGDPAGRSMRELLTGLAVAELVWSAGDPPPWYDCDTDTDLAWARAIAGRQARAAETESR